MKYGFICYNNKIWNMVLFIITTRYEIIGTDTEWEWEIWNMIFFIITTRCDIWFYLLKETRYEILFYLLWQQDMKLF